MKRFVKYFASPNPYQVEEDINKYANENNLLIVQISYVTTDIQQVFVVFEKLSNEQRKNEQSFK